jgi:alpha-beta hydrolase superfamily lysophospholipase
MSSTTAPTPAVWTPPPAVRVRGTIALLAGGGESARVYERFGRRLSADGYVLAAFDSGDAAEAVAWLGAQDEGPRILAGSDRGAAAALAEAAAGARIDGVVIAGLPVGDTDDSAATAQQRTACPVHLGVLGDSSAFAGSAAATPVPPAEDLARILVPVLAVHGGADPIAPLRDARERLRPVRELEFVETVDGLHDALNDASHRSVAATVVLWLERLRAAGVHAPIVRTVPA